MEQFDLVYLTVGDMKEAKKIATVLVEERLVACINIFEKITSIYKWGGELQENGEVAMIAKTTRPNIPSVVERVKELHSHKTPCIVSAPITSGNQEYLNWVYEATV
ncbi:MAG: divalent-cation tolerance protein CutA [Pseudomonadota bacterium]